MVALKQESRKPLTEAQRRYLEAFQSYVAYHGIPPTLRELSSVLRVVNSGVYQTLLILAKKGWLVRSGTFGNSRPYRLALEMDHLKSGTYFAEQRCATCNRSYFRNKHECRP